MILLAYGGDGDGGNELVVIINFPLYIWLWAMVMPVGELI
jgi:hypothetical protein